MVWVGAEYRFASTFSYRIPYFSSSYALSAPTPSPSTIKLAVVSAIINRRGDIEAGKNLFKGIKTATVAIALPKRIGVFKCFMKRLKQERGGPGFERTFGVREYIVYSDVLNVHLDVPREASESLLDGLKGIQYFGSSDSICSCVKSGLLEPDLTRCPQPFDGSISNQSSIKGIVFMLTDFTDIATFDSVDPFSEKKLEKDKQITLKPYIYPLKVVIKERDCTVYELSQ